MKKEFYIICDNIRSLENVGSIFRTSDALGITKIFLCGITGNVPAWETGLHKKIAKTAFSFLVLAQLVRSAEDGVGLLVHFQS